MDFPRLTPPAISIHDVNGGHDSRRTTGPSHHMTSGQFLSSSGPMPIPSKGMTTFAPPPLPPPPRINDLENGHDAGWLHANSHANMASTKLAPINPSSSLCGGRRPESDTRGDPMVLDESDGKHFGLPLTTSPEILAKPNPTLGEGSRNPVAVGAPGPILEGERDFSRRSVKDSSDAYDQHLLSKIGKPHSPRQSVSHGGENKGSLSTLPIPRPLGSLPSPGSDSSMLDVRWHNSPQSGAISPGIKMGWKDYTDCRSPSADSSAPSSAVDFDHSAYLRDVCRRRGVTTPQYDDNFSLPSRSNRGSYDQGVFSDIEGEFSSDDPLQSRYLINLREPTPPYLDASKTGTKRRASSPPREPMSDDRLGLHTVPSNGDLSQRRTIGHPFTNSLSVNTSLAPSQGSISAASSLSLRTSGSYSSAGLSVGGSSMTSMSPYERLSPVGLSPNSDLDSMHEKSLLHPSSPIAFAPQSNLRTAPSSNTLEPPNPIPGRKITLQTNLGITKPTPPKVGGLYLCECCPKKPKKFDNPEDLRAHEMEKQYSCQFCNNRFKNKNEAERHQNSLHLRRHSWSCSALPSYQAAFHASGSPSAQTSSGPSHDTCGYCGEEFPNFPQPDWDRRFEHLTSVHKFGECNNAKKFYRADHFRQHLKHSHAGTSGKWTNILENVCMKEEAPPDSKVDNRAPAPVANAAPSQVPSVNATGSGSGTLVSNNINEILSGC